MIPLLLDQGLPRSAAGLLRDAGWQVVHVGECGLSAASDEAVLEHARTRSLTVCTLDADFHTLLALSGAEAPSVIRIRRQGMHHSALVQLLLEIAPKILEAAQQGAAITVTAESIRIRFLPIIAPTASP